MNPGNEKKTRSGTISGFLYLPRGPIGDNFPEEVHALDFLASHASAPIYKINYRLGGGFVYPTPIHDVLAGNDWVVSHLQKTSSQSARKETFGLAVYGDLVGGGLATMLALTECRRGQLGAITSAAVHNPIVDWVSVDEKATPGGRKALDTRLLNNSATDLQREAVLRLRSQFFSKPSDYFDPFASPILFFRSAGKSVPNLPLDWGASEAAQNRGLEHNIHEPSAAHSLAEVGHILSDAAIPQMRRASKRFPTKTLGLRLPDFSITASSGGLFAGQASELVHNLRQSYVRQKKNESPTTSGFGRKALEEDEEDQMTLAERQVVEAAKADAKQKILLELHNSSGTDQQASITKWLDTIETNFGDPLAGNEHPGNVNSVAAML